MDAGRRSDLSYFDSMDRLEKSIIAITPSGVYEDAEAAKMGLKLSAYGLSKKEVTLLVHRIVYGETFEEAAKAAGYADRSAGMVIYNRALDKLRKKGYK